ncbi:MAG TPA: hypothetical protein VHK69_12230, partial [Chitinophagaceae bacterium]|nr:hypothetical protein [Chitinophagaceae bacterium]
MKSFLPLLSLAFLASCTSAYKTGQTPDDVYYSPTRPQDAYVHTETRQDRQERKYESDRRDDRYDEDYYYDRYLRMKIRNRSRWSTID